MRKTYIFYRDGIPEDVKLERWAWGVIYFNGEELKQFGDDGIFHQIGEIKQDEVKTFYFYNTKDEHKRITIIMPIGARVIHGYKIDTLEVGTSNEREIIYYHFGYKIGNQYHHNYIMPDDKIVQSIDRNIEQQLSKLM